MERTLLGQTFLRYYGNPRLDIKQTLTAAGNRSNPTCYPLVLSRMMLNEENRDLRFTSRIFIEKFVTSDDKKCEIHAQPVAAKILSSKEIFIFIFTSRINTAIFCRFIEDNNVMKKIFVVITLNNWKVIRLLHDYFNINLSV